MSVKLSDRRALLAGPALLFAAMDGAATVPATAWRQLPWLAYSTVLLPVVGGLLVCLIGATTPRRVSLPSTVVIFGVMVGRLALLVGLKFFVFLSLSDMEQQLPTALIMGIAWLIGHQIRLAHVHTEELRVQAAARTEAAQRLRIARDLHDQVAHSIGIIAIQAGAGRRVIGTRPDQARDALAIIEEASRQTLAGLRQTVGSLRQADPLARSETDPPPGPVGLADLDQLALATREAGVYVEVRWQGHRRPLPGDVDACAFRIIQEAVTNVVRHAGTSRCEVSIDCREDRLWVEITDEGVGGVPDGAGYGIVGMRERAALLGGRLAAGPRPGGGFRVAARLPVPAAAGAAAGGDGSPMTAAAP
jgi:signal transduction histidine kinase